MDRTSSRRPTGGRGGRGGAALALMLLAGAALALPGAPAHASEVVKLARLVITGKRWTGDPGAAAQTQPLVQPVAHAVVRPVVSPVVSPVVQLPRVVVVGRRSDDGMQLALHRRSLPRAL